MQNGNKYQTDRLADVMTELDMFDKNLISFLLNSDNIETKKVGLKMCLSKKKIYKKEDVEEINQLSELINTAFPVTAKIENKKSLLGKEKEVWICSCGKQNSFDSTYCIDCWKNKQGFLKEEIKPKTVQDALQRRAKIIQDYL